MIVEWERPFWYKDEFFASYGELRAKTSFVSYGEVLGENFFASYGELRAKISFASYGEVLGENFFASHGEVSGEK